LFAFKAKTAAANALSHINRAEKFIGIYDKPYIRVRLIGLVAYFNI